MSQNSPMNPRQIRRLYDRLHLVAQAASEAGVKVRFNAGSTCTDGYTIYIGSIPQGSVESALNMAMGYILHESFHVALTNFNVWNDTGQRLKAGELPMALNGLRQVIEDGFIEAHGMHRLPGAREHLDNLVGVMIERGGFPSLTQLNGFERIRYYVLYSVRSRWCRNRGVDALIDEGRPCVVADLGERVVDAIDAEIGSCPRANTSRNLDMACEILNLIGQAEPQAPEPQATDESDDSNPSGGDPDDAPGDSQAAPGGSQDPENDSPDDEPTDSEGDQPSDESEDDNAGDDHADDGDQDGADNDDHADNEGDDADDGMGDSDQRDTNNGDSDESDEDADQGAGDEPGNDSGQTPEGKAIIDGAEDGSNDTAEAVRQILDKMREFAESDQARVIHIPESGENVGVHNQLNVPNPASDRPNDGGVAGRLASQLRRLLVDRSRTRVQPARAGRQVHRQRLAASAAGQQSVFRNRQVGTDPDAAVAVLIDASASMSDTPRHMDQPLIDIALASSLALARALDRIPGVDSGIYAYTHSNHCRGQTLVSTMKSPKETLTAAMRRYAKPDHMGMTPTGEALLSVNEALARTERRNKLVILLTDGQANGSINPREAFRQGEQMGVTYKTIGIGQIMDPNTYPDPTTIDDVRDLPGAVFNPVRQALVA